MYIEAFIFNKILDLIIRILKDENKFILKNSYKAYIKIQSLNILDYISKEAL